MNQRYSKYNFKNFKLLIYALLVGTLVGIAGSFFRILIDYIQSFRDYLYSYTENAGISGWVTTVLFSVVSILIALFLVKKYAPETAGSGVHEIEGAMDGIRPMRWKHVLPVKTFASLLSLGSGLALGREGPTIQIGANIGKMVNDIFKQPDIQNNPLISAGAAAGLANAFNAPFSGIIFVIEEMHDHFRFNFFSVAAIMIGSSTADFVVRVIVGSQPVIMMPVFGSPEISHIWLFFVLGLLFALAGFIYNKLLIFSLENIVDKTKFPIIGIALFAGISIAVIGISFPYIVGGGYEIISTVLSNSFSLSFLVILFFVRLILSILSYDVGVPGGIFAPLLALGVISGYAFANIIQQISPTIVTHPEIFAIAGMAGIFASTVRAPLTGLMLAIEMTSNFELILPLVITTVTASVFTTILGNKPIYATLLKRTIQIEEQNNYSTKMQKT
jgi:CIC family chloride channel protein